MTSTNFTCGTPSFAIDAKDEDSVKTACPFLSTSLFISLQPCQTQYSRPCVKVTPDNKYYSLSSSVVLPLYPTTLTWDTLRSILVSNAAKGVRPGLVLHPLHLYFGVKFDSHGLEKISVVLRTLSSFLSYVLLKSAFFMNPQEHFLLSNQSDFSFHLTCTLCLRQQEVNGAGWLILLNVKVMRSMVHQIRVLRCEGERSEESLGEVLVSLSC